ncbi:GNAT family N-acetyltransferase [Amycolatopsis sp. H20-H5]|uniref:GNAT family N-acetyltransferase n=1 Tax=Amycolatopsis sp. H20-H5 TaxID=3046309 RepID=UPI002DB8E85C|nr:GNAT family N-acetyltransferase [Amycolatopsis sp. H20-H5]MEC3982668.1 GNAT family N-acetyltransferase [Amycolatopsis sp. H20-H5]
MSGIRAAEPSEVDAVVDVLTRAFQLDPVSTWLFEDDERRPGANRAFFRGVLGGLGEAGGRVDVTEDFGAVMLWEPGGAEDEGGDLAETFPGLLDAELARLGPLLGLMAERGPSGSAHHHAQFLGVLPGLQGQGIGGRLFRHGLDHFDAQGTPTYLEASSPTSARLYRRLGYRDVGEPFAPPGGAPMQPMWRDPA